MVGEAFWADWNPYGHFSQVQFELQRNVFDRLVEITPTLDIEPGLAERWKRIDDRTWEFSLRRGLEFHNGQPLTARDVKESVEIATGHTKFGKDKALLALIWGSSFEGEVVNDHTVRLHSSEPFSPLLNTLPLTDICHHADLAKGPDGVAGRPNGTGAFRLSKDEERKKTFKRFAKHYRKVGVPTLTFELNEESQTRLNALLARQADHIHRVRPDQVKSIVGREGFRAPSKTSIEIQTLWIRKDKRPFGNVHVRRALAWGIDRQAVASLVGGNTKAADSHLALGIQYRAPQEPAYAFDPQRAVAELKEAGLTPPVRLELLGSVGQYPKSKEASELLATNLREAGFDVKLAVLEAAAFNDRTAGDDPPDVFFSGWGNLTRDPDFAVSLPFHSPGAVTPEGNDVADALIDLGKRTPDGSEREHVYARLQRHLWTELPTVPVIYSDITEGISARVAGYDVNPNFIQYFGRATIVKA